MASRRGCLNHEEHLRGFRQGYILFWVQFWKQNANIALETLKHAHLTEIKSDQDPHNLARTFEESREVHVGRVQPLDDDGDGETRRGRASDLYNV